MAFAIEDKKGDSKVVIQKSLHGTDFRMHLEEFIMFQEEISIMSICAHTIDRCYKLHAHPSTFKGGKRKRVAVIVYGDEDDDDQFSTEPAHLTSE